MKKKKEIENLNTLNLIDLKNLLNKLREELRLLNFKNESAKNKNVKSIYFLKKQIARILTFINKIKNEKTK